MQVTCIARFGLSLKCKVDQLLPARRERVFTDVHVQPEACMVRGDVLLVDHVVFSLKIAMNVCVHPQAFSKKVTNIGRFAYV